MEISVAGIYQATKQDERTELGSNVLESLRGDAFLIAEELGLSVLKRPDAALQLIEAVRNHVFSTYFLPKEPTTYKIVGSKLKARLFTQCCSRPRLSTKKESVFQENH